MRVRLRGVRSTSVGELVSRGIGKNASHLFCGSVARGQGRRRAGRARVLSGVALISRGPSLDSRRGERPPRLIHLCVVVRRRSSAERGAWCEGMGWEGSGGGGTDVDVAAVRCGMPCRVTGTKHPEMGNDPAASMNDRVWEGGGGMPTAAS